MIDRNSIIASNPLDRIVQSYGHDLVKIGAELVTVCPFHPDKKPSLRINPEKQAWFCDPCGFGGSVIDFVSRRDGISVGDVMKKLSGNKASNDNGKSEVARYDYTDENGKLLYQVVRYVPKTFRQRHRGADGAWVWNMEGVRRVPYRLPEVIAAQDLFIVEGEKDADNLSKLGLTATCNVGGAKKWLDSYAEHFKKKNVIVIPDNDEPGKEHADMIVKSLTGVAARIFVWETGAKDVSDWLSGKPDPTKAVLDAIGALKPLNLTKDLPVQSMSELEDEYAASVTRSDTTQLSFMGWLPKLGGCVRPLVPGEVVVVLANTGVGKTAILQNIAMHASPLPTLIFQMELPGSLMFERFAQLSQGMSGGDVFNAYRSGNQIDWRTRARLDHIYVCTRSGMKANELESIINKSELKIGERPALVIVDYIGLMQGTGQSRYERISNVAESMKVLAKQTNTVLILASQIHRPEAQRKTNEVFLHDAKDSGSIENSAGLVLGAWREDDGRTMKIKILKNTKGRSGVVIDCNCNLELMEITQKPFDPQ